MKWGWGVFFVLCVYVFVFALCRAAARGDDCRRSCDFGDHCPGDGWCDKGGSIT